MPDTVLSMTLRFVVSRFGAYVVKRAATTGRKNDVKFEAEILALLPPKHPHLVHSFGWEPALNALVLEFIGGPTLCAAAHDLLPKQRRHILLGVGDAIGACHASGVWHRDVKSENIMLTTHRFSPKLIDFELAVFNPLNRPLTEVCGTPEFQPPECFTVGRYTNAVDTWAFVALVYELFHETSPFEGDDRRAVVNAVLACDGHFAANTELAGLYANVFRTSESERWPLARVIAHLDTYLLS